MMGRFYDDISLSVEVQSISNLDSTSRWHKLSNMRVRPSKISSSPLQHDFPDQSPFILHVLHSICRQLLHQLGDLANIPDELVPELKAVYFALGSKFSVTQRFRSLKIVAIT